MSNFNKTIFEAQSAEVIEICKPLKLFNIDYFLRTRFYKDKSYSLLTTHPLWTNYVLQKNLVGWVDFFSLTPGEYLERDLIKESLIFEEKQFNIFDRFLITSTHKNYVDTYFFAVQKPHTGIINFYYNHIDLLRKFIDYFECKSEKLFKKADYNRIIKPSFLLDTYSVNPMLFQINDQKKKSFLKLIGGRDNSVYQKLTLREKECIENIAHGKTAKDIARIINISYRTVEKHLENAKIKLGLFSKNQLVDLYYKEA